jgi:hypothetical protein
MISGSEHYNISLGRCLYFFVRIIMRIPLFNYFTSDYFLRLIYYKYHEHYTLQTMIFKHLKRVPVPHSGSGP